MMFKLTSVVVLSLCYLGLHRVEVAAQVLHGSSVTSCQIVDIGRFTVSIPRTFADKHQHCIEGGCWLFEEGDVSLDIDNSGYGTRPTFERSLPGYVDEVSEVDGIAVWIWSYIDNDVQYNGALYKTGRNGRYRLGIYVSCKKGDCRVTARSIFQSLRMKKKTN